jgi:dienelactone hydrolase
MRPKRAALAFAVISLALAALAWQPVDRHWHAAHLLTSLANAPPASSTEALPSSDLVETDLVIPQEGRTLRARCYRLASANRGHGLVVAHGVHHKGIDERRLVPFARALAREGLVVLTPELRDLADYRITLSGADDIEASVLYLSQRRDWVDGPRVGVLGFSFAGGLSLVAASRPALRDRLAYVASLGGHHDLERVLRFFVSNEIPTPTGLEKRPAHEYGLVVFVYGNVEAFVPEPDQDTARNLLREWLKEDREAARAHAKGCTTAPCHELLGLLEEGNMQKLGSRALALIEAHPAQLAALSPKGKLATIEAPVYLLHGTADSVIPPGESDWAAQELGPHPHRLLVTPLIEHVEVSKPAPITEKLALVRFMAGIM